MAPIRSFDKRSMIASAMPITLGGRRRFTAGSLTLPIVVLAFELGFGADVERLNNPCIDGCDDIHSTVEIGFVNACFPCIRKAALYSRLAIAHHGNGKTHEYLFALAKIFDGVSIAIKLSKISPLAHMIPLSYMDGAMLIGKVPLASVAATCSPPPGCSYAWHSSPVWVD